MKFGASDVALAIAVGTGGTQPQPRGENDHSVEGRIGICVLCERDPI